MPGLKIAPTLSFPLEAVTGTFGLLAMRGAGKTNAARVMAEEMFEAKLPFVAVDPVGSWWGLRSSRDGREPGVPVPIFGGKHADVPLDRHAGELVADLIVSKRLSCILDISLFESEGDKKAFLLSFARRLYARNEDPLHLFLEEADDFIPQRPMRDEAQLLRAWENIVRRGRSRGLGMTLLTQRSAAINKMVLTQVETLIALRTTSPQDRAAIEAWVKYHALSQEIIESLAGLEDGEAWVWSPHFLKSTQRIRFRLSRTFDSGATPKNVSSDRRRTPANMADIDLQDLRQRMATAIEEAKAQDPGELRKRIATLETELRRSRSRAPAADPEAAQKAVTQAKQEAAVAAARTAAKFLRLHRDILSSLEHMAGDIDRTMERIKGVIDAPLQTGPPSPQPSVSKASERGLVRAPGRRPAPPAAAIRSGDVSDLGGGALRMLRVLAQRAPARLTRTQWGTLAGLAHTGGTFSTYLSRLRTAGHLVEESGLFSVSDSGLAAAGELPPAPQTTAELVDMWRRAIGGGAARMLDVLVTTYPDSMTREQLAAALEMAVSSGTFSTYLSRLRSNGLAEVEGARVRAGAVLFEL